MDIENKYEASFDLEPESVENLKDIVHSEIAEISKRFNNGTETLDDLINNYRHLTIKFEMKNGTEQDLEIVELKYYLKLIEKVKAILNELDKKDTIINEYLKECYQFRAFCRRVRKDKKQDVDMFNQGREYSYIQFLNLVQGEENWSYEGNNFKKIEKELEQYTKKVEGK